MKASVASPEVILWELAVDRGLSDPFMSFQSRLAKGIQEAKSYEKKTLVNTRSSNRLLVDGWMARNQQTTLKAWKREYIREVEV